MQDCYFQFPDKKESKERSSINVKLHPSEMENQRVQEYTHHSFPKERRVFCSENIKR